MSNNLVFAPPYTLQAVPISSSSSSPPSACQCSRTFNLQCEQGATLSSQITIKLNGVPVNITGGLFEFTAKTEASVPDTDPSTVKIDWHETTTPTQGITWLVIPALTTQGMQPIGYQYQVRYVSPSNVVTPIVHGVLTITVPVSSRF